jgi:hypothetical protein
MSITLLLMALTIRKDLKMPCLNAKYSGVSYPMSKQSILILVDVLLHVVCKNSWRSVADSPVTGFLSRRVYMIYAR